MELKPNFVAEDLEQLVNSLLEINDNKSNKTIKPITDQLRRLNVVDNIHPEKIKRQSRSRKKLLDQCHIFIKQNNI